jgi:lipopolysaccharide transport system ATP-binding protein
VARYRFLDMFGLLGKRPGVHGHSALDGVSLEIARGEKLPSLAPAPARARSSLITSVIEPTSGTLEVKGKAHALLQIGTGFHPDFTGRENAHSYLAQLGVTGREADRKYARSWHSRSSRNTSASRSRRIRAGWPFA